MASEAPARCPDHIVYGSLAAATIPAGLAVAGIGTVLFPERAQYFEHSQAIKSLLANNTQLKHQLTEIDDDNPAVIKPLLTVQRQNEQSIAVHQASLPDTYSPTVDTLVSGPVGLVVWALAAGAILKVAGRR